MSAPRPILLVGIGNAGVTVLDRIAMLQPGLKGLLAINNDADSLASSVVAERLVFPQGEFAEGFLAIEEDFGAAIAGAAAVIFCGGLGGGIGSFLLPALAARAKATGVTTLASVGIPFAFEGRQKRELASGALRKLHEFCDAVAVIDNDRLSGGVPSTAAVGEAFLAADRMLQTSLLALQGMLFTSGPVKIGRNDLAAVLGVPGAMTLFGFGSSEGSNRLHEALEMALKSPLLSVAGKGPALQEASTILLLLSGPADLSFAEVQRAVSEIERIAGDRCQVKVGVHAGGSPGSPLELFITASSGGGRTQAKSPEVPRSSHPVTAGAVRKAEPVPAPDKVLKPMKPGAVKQTQGVLDLDSYQRGRFDKSEPTIVAGEDLDIPTFLRKGVKLGSPLRH